MILRHNQHCATSKQNLVTTITTCLCFSIFLVIVVVAVNIDCSEVNSSKHISKSDIRLEFLKNLKNKDTCGTFYFSEASGYKIKEYKVVTNDNYELTLHRLIHPTDFTTDGPKLGTKKPYILLHGLIGSSASFLRNIKFRYKAPKSTFNWYEDIDRILKHKSKNHEHRWRSVADHFMVLFEGDKPRESYEAIPKRLLKNGPDLERGFSMTKDIEFDSDSSNFGREFKQAYRKYDLPSDAKNYITNSLALTLSNFGYDVWLINLRGNAYSRSHKGTLEPNQVEYWNFDIDKLIKEDLVASLNFVKELTQYSKSMGLICYSYSSIHILGLLTKFPNYLKSLQPIVMMAPTLLTSASHSERFGYFMRLITKTLLSNNGPFPVLGRSKQDKIERFLCSLPITSNLCLALESILYGRVTSSGPIEISKMLINNDKNNQIIKKDSKCGQTSIAVLHQIIDNLKSKSIHAKYLAYVKARNTKSIVSISRGELPINRSIMLIHSKADKISTPIEVAKIRNTALKNIALVDVHIKEPNFEHTDFLFSKKNQYLVNGEIVRMVTVFDFMLTKQQQQLQDSNLL